MKEFLAKLFGFSSPSEVEKLRLELKSLKEDIAYRRKRARVRQRKYIERKKSHER